MSALCLTGWQQPVDALKALTPKAQHFDYSRYSSCDEFFTDLPRETDCAIGWSLGGQLLARAVAGGYIRPKKLVLLAAPFQWVADARFPHGIPRALAEDARARYRREPEAMLKNLNAVIALGDPKEKAIRSALNKTLQVWENGLFWLDALTASSCAELDFSGFPPTTIIQGDADKVIFPANGEAFAGRIAGAVQHLLPGCAHAPHLHDLHTLSRWIDNV